MGIYKNEFEQLKKCHICCPDLNFCKSNRLYSDFTSFGFIKALYQFEFDPFIPYRTVYAKMNERGRFILRKKSVSMRQTQFNENCIQSITHGNTGNSLKTEFFPEKREINTKISKRPCKKHVLLFVLYAWIYKVMTMAISWLYNIQRDVIGCSHINVFQNGIKFTEQKKREAKNKLPEIEVCNQKNLQIVAFGLQNLITYRNLIIWVQSVSNTKADPFLCHTFFDLQMHETTNKNLLIQSIVCTFVGIHLYARIFI